MVGGETGTGVPFFPFPRYFSRVSSLWLCRIRSGVHQTAQAVRDRGVAFVFFLCHIHRFAIPVYKHYLRHRVETVAGKSFPVHIRQHGKSYFLLN